MKKKRAAAAGLLLAAGLFILFTGCAGDRGVAAKVNGKRIYIKEVNEMVTRYVAISKKLNPAYSEPAGLLLENMRKQFLDGLIDKTIILDKARELKVAVSDGELSAKIAQLKKTNEILDEASFSGYLKAQGISEGQFRDNIRDIMMMEKTRDKFFADIVVSDSESQAYYKANPAAYARETIRFAHVLLKMPAQDRPEMDMATLETKLRKARPDLSGDALKSAVDSEAAKVLARAEAVAKQAKAGRDFSALAMKYSEDITAKSGGDLGIVSRGDMLPEIDQVLFTLKTGEIAGPVKSRLGYHILKALSDPKKEVRPFEEVRSDIVSTLVLEKRQARLKSLREHLKIKVLWNYKS
jgi:parvulin-like peptidyl-prolyl isomerase